jgi:hypothetical protein
MKGVGNILDGLYPWPGERILHDIDILVPDEMFEKAAEILLLDGYKSNYKYDLSKKLRHRHYPILFKPGEPVYAELHLSAVGGSSAKYFSTGMVFENAGPALVHPGFLVMSDEHKIIHNFLHAQLDHAARIHAREFIRNLYDLLLLSSRSNPGTIFSNFHRFRRTSSGYLDIFYFTFGINPSVRHYPPLFIHSYLFRYRLNLRFRFVSVTSTLLIKIFLGYIAKPIRALFDKDLRMQLLSNLKDPAWYRKQGNYYGRLFKRTMNHRP